MKSLNVLIFIQFFAIALFSQNFDIEGSWYEINRTACQKNLLNDAASNYVEFTFDKGNLTTSSTGTQSVGNYIIEDNQLILSLGLTEEDTRIFDLAIINEDQIAFDWQGDTITLRRLVIKDFPPYLNQYNWLNDGTASSLLKKRFFTVLVQDNLVSKSKVIQFLDNKKANNVF